jgi:hypothetical protein
VDRRRRAEQDFGAPGEGARARLARHVRDRPRCRCFRR